MRRLFFALVFGFLVLDAAGLESLLIAERCTLNETLPDGNCPPTCLRCACAQPIVASDITIATIIDDLKSFPDAPSAGLAPASLADILHVPKRLLLTL